MKMEKIKIKLPNEDNEDGIDVDRLLDILIDEYFEVKKRIQKNLLKLF